MEILPPSFKRKACRRAGDEKRLGEPPGPERPADGSQAPAGRDPPQALSACLRDGLVSMLFEVAGARLFDRVGLENASASLGELRNLAIVALENRDLLLRK